MLGFSTKSTLIKICEDPCNRKHPLSFNVTTKKKGQYVVFVKEAIVWNCLKLPFMLWLPKKIVFYFFQWHIKHMKA
jgi:hypothetical protein